MNERIDVIVIGAGIIGASIARKLADSGLHVSLVDAGTMGAEASWAGAGMLAPGGELDKSGPWSEFAVASLRPVSGPEIARRLQVDRTLVRRIWQPPRKRQSGAYTALPKSQ